MCNPGKLMAGAMADPELSLIRFLEFELGVEISREKLGKMITEKWDRLAILAHATHAKLSPAAPAQE